AGGQAQRRRGISFLFHGVQPVVPLTVYVGVATRELTVDTQLTAELLNFIDATLVSVSKRLSGFLAMSVYKVVVDQVVLRSEFRSCIAGRPFSQASLVDHDGFQAVLLCVVSGHDPRDATTNA